MAGRTVVLKIGLVGGFLVFLAACAAPEYRWIKPNTDSRAFRVDLQACHQTVDQDFNPYYDYGMPGASASAEALFRQDAAEQMFRDCMRGRGYKLVRIEPPGER